MVRAWLAINLMEVPYAAQNILCTAHKLLLYLTNSIIIIIIIIITEFLKVILQILYEF